jgi:hypothetical protein
MEKYIISNVEFSSKNKIKKYIQEIEKKYLDYQPVIGNDLEFMLGVFKYHPRYKNKTKQMTDMYFAPSKEYTSTRCVYIAYGNKNTDIKKRPSNDISWTLCLKKIKKISNQQDALLEFGQYRGKTIHQVGIFDRPYLEWIASEQFKDTKKSDIKEHVQNYLKMNIEQKINNIILTNPIQSTVDFEYQSNRFKQPVAQYDICGNIIRTYDCIKETKKSGYNPTIVSKCIHNKIKLHDNNIFIKIDNKDNVINKIDPTPFINNRNKIKKSKPPISNIIENNKESITIKPKGMRIGMFNKQNILLEVFTKEQQVINKFGHVSGVYDHLYGKIKKKNKIKKGYKNLYFFRKLNIGQTYTLGNSYDLSQFEISQPRKIVTNIKTQPVTVIEEPKITPIENTIPPIEEPKTIPVENMVIPVEEIKTIPVEDIIIPTEEPKRNFMQRLRYLFTGK